MLNRIRDDIGLHLLSSILYRYGHERCRGKLNILLYSFLYFVNPKFSKLCNKGCTSLNHNGYNYGHNLILPARRSPFEVNSRCIHYSDTSIQHSILVQGVLQTKNDGNNKQRWNVADSGFLSFSLVKTSICSAADSSCTSTLTSHDVPSIYP